MEEAEELASKIGIMVRGKFRCVGTVSELKERFGDGYHLDVKVPIPRVEDFKDFMKNEFEDSELTEEHFGRMAFRIPVSQVPFLILPLLFIMKI